MLLLPVAFHSQIALGKTPDPTSAYSFWDIVDTLTRRLPLDDKKASKMPFIPSLENCTRCKKDFYKTKDGIDIDITAFNNNKIVKYVTIGIHSNSKNICILLSQARKRYALKDSDKDIDGLEGGDYFYSGYKKEIGSLWIHFLSIISLSDNIPFSKRCLSTVYFDHK